MSYWSYMSALDFIHKMRDPIYGFVPITKLEMEIIDTPVFQRLRRIHQLALTKYVYPSAEHSRFVHSIGVMHCASLIYEGIFNHKLTDVFSHPAPKSLQLLRLAALLHDIGHLPFSHAAEEEILPPAITHEDLSAYIITNYPGIANKMKEADYDPKLVAMLLSKTPRSDFRLEHDIISGNLDADRADYLLRDSRTCGVCYGEYDFARFLQMFAVTHGDDNHYKLCVGEKDLWQVEALLIARYHYTLQVPYHKARSGFDIALRKFIKSLPVPDTDFSLKVCGQDIQELNFESFINFDDYSLIEKAKYNHCNSIWADYMLRKEHLVTLLDMTSHIEGGWDKFEKAHERLKDEGFREGEDYFLQQHPIAILKGATVPDMEEPETKESNIKVLPYGSIYLRCKGEDKPIDICERSWIFKQFKDAPLNILRVYVTLKEKEKMRKILQERAT